VTTVTPHAQRVGDDVPVEDAGQRVGWQGDAVEDVTDAGEQNDQQARDDQRGPEAVRKIERGRACSAVAREFRSPACA
jgi:hypothetical protein